MSNGERSEKLLFLPGSGGDLGTWRGVSSQLSHGGVRQFMGWPGLGGVPADATVTGIGDLVRRVTEALSEPTVLLAQSMGGLVALRAALSAPAHVRGLVLAVTSGGIDVGALGATDWRPEPAAAQASTPRWFVDARDDLAPELGRVQVPALLLWGDADPISPVAVGRRLAELLSASELVVVPGGTHDLVSERADEVTPHIERYLRRVL